MKKNKRIKRPKTKFKKGDLLTHRGHSDVMYIYVGLDKDDPCSCKGHILINQASHKFTHHNIKSLRLCKDKDIVAYLTHSLKAAIIDDLHSALNDLIKDL